MANNPSTSTTIVPVVKAASNPSDRILESIKNKFKKRTVTLKVMHFKNSVIFISNPDISYNDICEFYLPKALRDEPSTAESELIKEKLVSFLNTVQPSIKLSSIKHKINEFKTFFNEGIKLVQTLKETGDNVDKETAPLTARLNSMMTKLETSMNGNRRRVRELYRQGQTNLRLIACFLEAAQSNPNYAGESDNNVHQLYSERKRLTLGAIERLPAVSQQLDAMHENLTQKFKIASTAVDSFPEVPNPKFVQELEPFRRKIRNFASNITSTDSKAQDIIAAIRLYMEDVKNLVAYYIEDYEIFQTAITELIEIHKQLALSVSLKLTLVGKKKLILGKFLDSDEKMSSINDVLDEIDTILDNNSRISVTTEQLSILRSVF